MKRLARHCQIPWCRFAAGHSGCFAHSGQAHPCLRAVLRKMQSVCSLEWGLWGTGSHPRIHAVAAASAASATGRKHEQGHQPDREKDVFHLFSRMIFEAGPVAGPARASATMSTHRHLPTTNLTPQPYPGVQFFDLRDQVEWLPWPEKALPMDSTISGGWTESWDTCWMW